MNHRKVEQLDRLGVAGARKEAMGMLQCSISNTRQHSEDIS